MKELATFILRFGNLNQQQLDFILNKAIELTLNEDEYFSEAGKIPRQVGFLFEGVVRGYYINKNGEEITRCFISENNFVADYINFEDNAMSSEYLQAVTDSKLLIFSKKDWDNFSNEISGWEKIKYKIIQRCFFQKSRKGPVASEDATTRYLEFLDNYPTLINRISLSHVASYLGVTPQSLSRIRRNIK